MGNSDYERIEDDFYATPEWFTRDFIKRMQDVDGSPVLLEHDWWEPACGEGHIVRVMAEFSNKKAFSTDLVHRGFGIGDRDFFEEKELPGPNVRMIMTNPPFGDLAERFIDHALNLMEIVDGTVIMLLRNEYDCSKKRMRLFDQHPAYYGKAVCTSRPRWISGTTGSPRHNYAWYMWDWTKPRNDDPKIFYYTKNGD